MEKLFIDRRNPLLNDINNRLLDMMHEDHAKVAEQRDHLHKVLTLTCIELQKTGQNALLSAELMSLIQNAINQSSSKQYSH